mgnify:CR=1 FL=1
MKPQWNRFASALTAGALFTLASTSLHGAGFILQEQSVSGLGVGFASGAAGLDDNSSMYFNPATMSLVPGQQVTGALHIIMPEAEFKNNGSLSAFNGVSGVPTQGPNDTSDKIAVVPNVYYSAQVTDQLHLGVGISTPYGLATSYEEGWVGRHVALETDLLTINTNFAASYKISEKFVIGGGISVLYADALLSNAIDFGALYLQAMNAGTIPPTETTLAIAQDVQANLGGTKYDGSIELTGDDFGYGWNIGALFMPSESTRIGFHYRSNVKLTIDGDADFTVGALDAFFGGRFSDQGGMVDINLPDTAQVSVHQYLTPQWAVMADLFHTWWSKFDKLDIAFEDGNLPNNVIPENWDNAWRYSIGTTYDLNESWQLRAGLVYDESPVPDAAHRSPRIPDEDRVWISLGFGYRINDSFDLNVAYVHIFVDDPVIDNPIHTAGSYLKGTMEATVNIISVGGSFSF